MNDPTAPAPMPEPQAGGSYRRNADGSLELVEYTAIPGQTHPHAPDEPADQPVNGA